MAGPRAFVEFGSFVGATVRRRLHRAHEVELVITRGLVGQDRIVCRLELAGGIGLHHLFVAGASPLAN